jgi:hypothetical protein
VRRGVFPSEEAALNPPRIDLNPAGTPEVNFVWFSFPLCLPISIGVGPWLVTGSFLAGLLNAFAGGVQLRRRWPSRLALLAMVVYAIACYRSSRSRAAEPEVECRILF